MAAHNEKLGEVRAAYKALKDAEAENERLMTMSSAANHAMFEARWAFEARVDELMKACDEVMA